METIAVSEINQKNHHYLPIGILKLFGLGKKNQQIFFTSKKLTFDIKKTNIKNVGCINHFYNFEKTKDSLEVNFFGPIDGKAPKILKNLLLLDDISRFEKNQINDLVRYVASQICRVPYIYKNINSVAVAFKEQISDDIEIFEGNTNDFFLKHVVASTELYATLLLKKKMTVCRSKTKEFVIGDNPVVILEGNNNVVMSGKYASAIDAKIFMMPISPSHVLVFFDEWDREKIYGYVSNNNDLQFVNSVEFVFSHAEETLRTSIKQHHVAAYRFIETTKPSLIDDHKLIKGNPIYIEQAKLLFKGNARDSLRKLAEKNIQGSFMSMPDGAT